MRWPTPCKSPKMSWRNSRRLLLKLVSHSEEGTLLLSAAHLIWVYPTPVMSSSASRMWAFCCSRDCLCAKESLGSLVASGLSLWPRSTKAGTRAVWLSGSTGRQPCAVAPGWALLLPDGGRNIQTGIALLWPWQHFRACTVLGSGDVGLADWLSHVDGQCRCCIFGLCRCILGLVSKTEFVYLAIMEQLVVMIKALR